MKHRYSCTLFRLIGFVLFSSLVFLFVGLSVGCRPSPGAGGNTSNVALKTGTANSTEINSDGGHAEAGRGGGNVPTEGAPTRNDAPPPSDEILLISWSFSPTQYRGKNGQQYTFRCPANGNASTVYGTDVYTDDSSICTAAVHKGLISAASGGVIRVEIRPGQDAYVGSERNTVKTSDFNNHWNGSFVFVGGGNTGGS